MGMYISWLDSYPDKIEVGGSSPSIPTVLVAQLVRAVDCGSTCCGFKSHLTPQYTHLAQRLEQLPYTQEVLGSSPRVSTISEYQSG